MYRKPVKAHEALILYHHYGHQSVVYMLFKKSSYCEHNQTLLGNTLHEIWCLNEATSVQGLKLHLSPKLTQR